MRMASNARLSCCRVPPTLPNSRGGYGQDFVCARRLSAAKSVDPSLQKRRGG